MGLRMKEMQKINSKVYSRGDLETLSGPAEASSGTSEREIDDTGSQLNMLKAYQYIHCLLGPRLLAP